MWLRFLRWTGCGARRLRGAPSRPVDLSTPTPVEPAELRRRIDAGEWGGRSAGAHRVRRRASARLARVRAVGQLRHLPGLALPLTAPRSRSSARTPRQVAAAQRELVPGSASTASPAPATGVSDSLEAGCQGPMRSLSRVSDLPGPRGQALDGAQTRSKSSTPAAMRNARPSGESTGIGAHPAARAARAAATRCPRVRSGSTAAPATAPRSPPRCSTTPDRQVVADRRHLRQRCAPPAWRTSASRTPRPDRCHRPRAAPTCPLAHSPSIRRGSS